jgi:hypothetical protein
MISQLVWFGYGDKVSPYALNIFGYKSHWAKQKRVINYPTDAMKQELKIVLVEPVVNLSGMVTTQN